MKEGIHLRKVKYKLIQTDGSSISLDLSLPLVTPESLSKVDSFVLNLNQDIRSHKLWSISTDSEYLDRLIRKGKVNKESLMVDKELKQSTSTKLSRLLNLSYNKPR